MEKLFERMYGKYGSHTAAARAVGINLRTYRRYKQGQFRDAAHQAMVRLLLERALKNKLPKELESSEESTNTTSPPRAAGMSGA